MESISGLLRFITLGLILTGLFFASVFIFTIVVGVLLVLGAMEWLRRKNILTDEAFSGPVEMPHKVTPETVTQARIIDAEYVELGHPKAKL